MRFIPEAFQGPIGNLIIVHGMLDHQLTQAIWRIANIPDRQLGNCFISFVRDFEAKIDLFSQLSRLRFSGHTQVNDLVTALVRDMDKQNEMRNRLVHGTFGHWTQNTLTGEIAISSLKPKPRAEEYVVRSFSYTTTQIVALAHDIAETIGTLTLLNSEIVAVNNRMLPEGMQLKLLPQSLLTSPPPNPINKAEATLPQPSPA
ncbi:MAG TPA: hypothetical protein VHT51_10375 [Micropepsaceae bacterium]|jgi:hypothetical protein|nr:hypothetical protein [Micropepsaceae bacterium]